VCLGVPQIRREELDKKREEIIYNLFKSNKKNRILKESSLGEARENYHLILLFWGWQRWRIPRGLEEKELKENRKTQGS